MKSTAKSPARTPRKVPQPHGGALNAGGTPGNSGGKKGRSGRKPDEFKAMCRELASSDDTEKAVIKALKDPKHPAFLGALKWASEHGYGGPARSVDVTSKGEQISGVVVLPATGDE